MPGRVEDGDVFIQPFDLDGRGTIFAFTSERVLNQALRHNAGAIELPGRALLESLPAFDSLILDYRTRLQKEMTRTEVAALLDGSIFKLMRSGSLESLMLGRPRHYPVQLLDSLRPMLSNSTAFAAAYLCQSQRERDGATRIIIAIESVQENSDEVDVESARAAFDSIAQHVQNFDATISVILLGDDAASEFMRRETEPWWRREQSA